MMRKEDLIPVLVALLNFAWLRTLNTLYDVRDLSRRLIRALVDVDYGHESELEREWSGVARARSSSSSNARGSRGCVYAGEPHLDRRASYCAACSAWHWSASALHAPSDLAEHRRALVDRALQARTRWRTWSLEYDRHADACSGSPCQECGRLAADEDAAMRLCANALDDLGDLETVDPWFSAPERTTRRV